MRISELSAASGVPIATIKFYLRDGLLPSGERTGVNQAAYTDGHLRRLRLIRALIEVGGVSVAAVRGVLAAVDDTAVGTHDLLGAVQYALTPSRPNGSPAWTAARADVDALIDRLGWTVRPDAPTRDRLADALLALRTLAGTELDAHDCFAGPAALAGRLADAEIATLPPADAPRTELAESVVVGVALHGAAFAALRLLAEEDASHRRYG